MILLTANCHRFVQVCEISNEEGLICDFFFQGGMGVSTSKSLSGGGNFFFLNDGLFSEISKFKELRGGSGSEATRALLQGLPHGKPEVLAIGTEATFRFQDTTLQRV